MQSNNRVQIAGLMGMMGAVLWAVVNILEVTFGLFFIALAVYTTYQQSRGLHPATA